MLKVNRISNFIDTAAAMSISDRQKSLRWLSHQNELVIYDVFKLQKNHFHRLKSQKTDDDLILLAICSLFLALKEAISSAQIPNRKHKSGDFGFLRQVSKNRAKQFRKARKKAKHEKLFDLQSVVLNLIDNEKYSYREVSGYLLKYHKFGVSHTMIGDFYRSMKEVQDA